jgi:hypothetical protein
MKGQKAGGSWILRRRLRWIIFAAISLALVLGGVNVITAYEPPVPGSRRFRLRYSPPSTAMSNTTWREKAPRSWWPTA